ncbi:hypothetical protein Sme01_38450 [Sphaerisporangium melleum]|uniref:Uncharacterized protein n=1 Tax=Sphaerisporangium melleum TaxID=321316 RepID=A0A917VIK1_9ACTN|nr:hypothetical protein [Sphaerisporangium melleum]GGK82162.1 hypothetical protein GCM10007964_26040 [Sphaerisporangium melleum]GII71369.1 hypothetical protein Sme01_38450 [Sphaerisporangium melleum]
MSFLLSLHDGVHAAVQTLAADIDNPAPQDPTAGSNGVTLLLAYAKWGALIACAVAAVVSGGLMAVGALSNRPDHADKGKRALVWSLGGVVVTAIAIPMVNTVFGAAS